MKLFLCLLVSFQLLFSSCTKSQTPGWKLTWSDEFSTNGKPDPAKWSFSGRGTANWKCYCTDDTATAFVKDGFLYLNGILSANSTDTATYNTGCIQTKGKFSFKYGKLEVRAKLSQGQGSWPAIWLLGEDGAWPNNGEIDVMEHLNFDTIFYQTMHSYFIDKLNHKHDPKYFTTASFKVNDFNVYGMEWYPDRIDLFVNGHKTFSYPKIQNDTTGKQWPFDQPFYIILDQALGGNWPGPVNKKDLPQQMIVDWVRVYQ